MHIFPPGQLVNEIGLHYYISYRALESIQSTSVPQYWCIHCAKSENWCFEVEGSWYLDCSF